MSGFIVFVVFTLGLSSGTDASALKDTADATELDRIVEDFLDWRLYEWPVYGTKFGLPEHNDRMENYTEAAFTKEKMRAEVFLQKVNELHGLGSQDHFNAEILKNLLEHFITGYKYRKYSIYNSVSPIEHLVSELQKFISLMPTDTEEDYDNFLARYRLIAEQVLEKKALMEEAAAEGLTAHNSSLNVLLSTLDNLLAKDTEDTLFFEPFQTSVMQKAFSDDADKLTTVQETAGTLIEGEILRALRQYRDYVRDEYSRKTRQEAGVGSLPGGNDYYQACLNWHLSVEMSPQQIYDLGISEVHRIEGEMSRIMQENGFNGTLTAYKERLMSDPSNFFQTGEEILAEYERIINGVHEELPTILLHVPEARVEVRESDSEVIGRYSDPPLDGSRPGIFWANVKNPGQKPKFNMMALALHEAEPGHHTQSAYSIETDIPKFRRAIEYLRYNSVPFNWAFQTAYSEGWALYAESLGEEMGVYTEPHTLFGRYASEIHRAARLVVDTGIHAFGWSIEKAEQYMKNHTTLGPDDIAAEVRRYVGWPGQACSYKIGELKIRELRNNAEKQLGEDFDLREFHDQILNVGQVPLSLLEQHISDWVADKKGEVSMATRAFYSNITIIVCLLACILSSRLKLTM